METYEHRQTGYATAIIGVFVVVWLVGSAVAFDGVLVAGALTAVVASVVVAIFTTLRTRVDAEAIDVAFTFGFPKRIIPISDIDSHSPIRNKWFYGWGVRLVPGGVLYSVWGLDSVAVTYRKGTKTKTLRIGTDDLAGLDAAITTARDASAASG